MCLYAHACVCVCVCPDLEWPDDSVCCPAQGQHWWQLLQVGRLRGSRPPGTNLLQASQATGATGRIANCGNVIKHKHIQQYAVQCGTVRMLKMIEGSMCAQSPPGSIFTSSATTAQAQRQTGLQHHTTTRPAEMIIQLHRMCRPNQKKGHVNLINPVGAHRALGDR